MIATFSEQELPDDLQYRMKQSKTWSPKCPVPMDRLRLLQMQHYNFFGEQMLGSMVVLDKVALSVLAIFEELYMQRFPIESIKTIDRFDSNDNVSMDVNNCSCFNFRKIAGTDRLSMHSYGLAIDVNPVQNPFIIIGDNNLSITPFHGREFLNRANQREGMVEPVVHIFRKYGFTEWGGEWNSPIDYHHFQVSRDKLLELAF